MPIFWRMQDTEIATLATRLQIEARLRAAGWLMIGLGFLAALIF